jgi:hypothetical protein
VSCTFKPSEHGAHGAPVDGSTDSVGSLPSDLSERILDALVDEHGRDVVDGGERSWFRKRREGTGD